MSLDWSFGDHNARVQEGARNATLVDQTGAWHLRIKYDPPIIVGEHWDVLIAWNRQYTPSFTEASYSQIQRYTQAGMGDYSLTNFEFKWDDCAV